MRRRGNFGLYLLGTLNGLWTVSLRLAGWVVCLAVVSFAAPAVSLGQGRVEGAVTNGTLGRPVAELAVRLLTPRGGMQQIASTWTDQNGHFVFSQGQIDPKALYLVSTEFQGVPYNQIAQFNDGGTASVDLMVYESTRSDSGLSISELRALVAAEGDKAHIQEQYAVDNVTNPPRSYFDPAATFRFHVPNEVTEPAVTVTGLMNMPLPQEAQAGRSPGEFSIRYPFKPGVTIVTVQYELGYTPGGLRFHEQASYPIVRAELFVYPPTLEVRSSVFKFEAVDSDRQVARFEAARVPRGAVLDADLSGESGPPEESGNGQQSEEVKVLPNAMTRLSVPLLACFLILLFWALGVRIAREWKGAKAGAPAGPQRQRFSARVESWLNSLADLDELFAAGKIAEGKYWKERLELKAKLVAILKKHPPAALESYAARHIPR
jgi:hypothetical protein